MYVTNLRNQHTDVLERNLHSLRDIRALSEVQIVTQNPHSGPMTNHIVDEFNAKSREYLDVIEKEMMRPVLDNGLPDAGL